MSHHISQLARPACVALAAVLALTAGWAGLAHAGLSSEGGGNIDGVPLYRTLAFGGIDRNQATDPGYAFEDIYGIDYVSNSVPRGLTNVSGTVAANGATFTGYGQSYYSGWYAARNYAQISVNNAQATDNYYQVAGHGTATTLQFFTPDAQVSGGHATFTWHVSGSETNPLAALGARATGRFDFGATTGTEAVWTNLFNDPGNKLDSITEFVPGTYTYNLPIADLGQVIRLFYWSSAFAQVNPGQAPQGSNFTLTANYSNTIVLEQVQLFDAQGQPVPEWQLYDDDLGDTVFDQAGRLAPVLPPPLPIPEPGVWVLLLAGLGAVFERARRGRD